MYPSTYDARDVVRLAKKLLGGAYHERFLEIYRVVQDHEDHEVARLTMREGRDRTRALYVLSAITLAELMGALARLLTEQRAGEKPDSQPPKGINT